ISTHRLVSNQYLRYELVHHSVTKPHRAELGPAEAKEAAVSSGRPERDPASSKSVKSWLGRLDSNQGMPESKSGALPLGYAPFINDLRALRPWLLPNLLPKRPNRSAYLRGARAY